MLLIKLPKFLKPLKDILNGAVAIGLSKLIALLDKLKGKDVFEQNKRDN